MQQMSAQQREELEMAEVKTSKRYDVPGAEMWERIGDPADL